MILCLALNTENVYTQNTMNAGGSSLYIWVHGLKKPRNILQKSGDGAFVHSGSILQFNICLQGTHKGKCYIERHVNTYIKWTSLCRNKHLATKKHRNTKNMHFLWHNARIYIQKNFEYIVMINVSTSMYYFTSSVQITTIFKCYTLWCTVLKIHGSLLAYNALANQENYGG